MISSTKKITDSCFTLLTRRQRHLCPCMVW